MGIADDVKSKVLASRTAKFKAAGVAGGYNPGDTYLPVMWDSSGDLSTSGGVQQYYFYNVDRGEYLLFKDGSKAVYALKSTIVSSMSDVEAEAMALGKSLPAKPSPTGGSGLGGLKTGWGVFSDIVGFFQDAMSGVAGWVLRKILQAGPGALRFVEEAVKSSPGLPSWLGSIFGIANKIITPLSDLIQRAPGAVQDNLMFAFLFPWFVSNVPLLRGAPMMGSLIQPLVVVGAIARAVEGFVGYYKPSGFFDKTPSLASTGGGGIDVFSASVDPSHMRGGGGIRSIENEIFNQRDGNLPMAEGLNTRGLVQVSPRRLGELVPIITGDDPEILRKTGEQLGKNGITPVREA